MKSSTTFIIATTYLFQIIISSAAGALIHNYSTITETTSNYFRKHTTSRIEISVHMTSSSSTLLLTPEEEPFITSTLFIECGFGNDSHGQSSTKAAVRACRNAIEFNSIPSIKQLVPGGYDNMRLSVILAVPPKYQDDLDLQAVAAVFPYGNVKFTVQDGGMVAPSGIAIDRLGDKGDDMVVVCAAVTVGFKADS